MVENELKGCPFCGGNAFLQNGATAPNGDQYVIAWCIECGATSREDRDDAGAIAAWNRRSPDPIREEMARALEPFAQIANCIPEGVSSFTREPVSIGHLRAARAALSKHRDHPPAHRSGK